jgi:hypothetical protein
MNYYHNTVYYLVNIAADHFVVKRRHYTMRGGLLLRSDPGEPTSTITLEYAEVQVLL